MILENNIKSLETRYSYLKGVFPIESDKVSSQETKSGDKTVIYKDTYLHSSRNPLRECKKLVNQIEKNNLYIFGGIGFAYLVKELVKREPNSIIVLYEPTMELFSKLLEEIDITDLINNPNIYFIITPEWSVIQNFLSGKRVRKVTYIPLLPRIKHDQELFTPLESYITQYNKKVEINKNTLKKFGKLWVKNQCLNLPYMGYKGDISEVFGSFDDIPGIIVSAGPSMEIIIPHLKRLKESFLILCVDTAFKSLLEEGVEPDFVVSIDAQYWNARHLEVLECNKSILIADPSIQPAAIRPFNNRVYFTKSSFPLGQYFEKFREPLTKIASGGSVSTTIWDLAQKLNLSEVFLVGQDLGYPGGITHYKNSYFEKRMINQCDRFNPVESQSFKYIYNGFPTLVNSNQDKNIISDKRMKIYIDWFNEQAEISKTRGYNLSPMGCKLNGIPYKPLETILSYPSKRKEINNIIRKLDKKDNYHYIQNLLEGALNIEKILNSLTLLGKKALNLALTIENEYKKRKPVNNLLDELSIIDQEIIKEGFSNLLSFIIEPFADSITKSTESNPYKALLESIELYKDLTRTGELHLKHLNYSIKNMKLILKDEF